MIVDAFNPYPCWEKRLIKRKYGGFPAVYLDVCVPYENIFDLLPKHEFKSGYWRLKKDVRDKLR